MYVYFKLNLKIKVMNCKKWEKENIAINIEEKDHQIEV